MLSLIALLIFGSIIAYLSLQNTMLVSVNFLDVTISNIPLFYVIIGSMLIGIFLSYAIYLFRSLLVAITLNSKDRKIMNEQKEVAELTKRVNQLETENVKLKEQIDTEVVL